MMSDYSFDAAAVRDRMVAGIQELAEKQHFSKVVIGISGGKDSTVSAALCACALGKENVYGVMLPDGEQKDIADSQRVCDVLGIHQRVINIGPMHQALKEATDQLTAQCSSAAESASITGTSADAESASITGTPADAESASAPNRFFVPYSQESDFNVGPRLRMTTLRYIAQALGARLVGTGNLSEATVGYCTKDGDTSCDFSLLGNLTSVEVVKVGLSMEELPRELVEKTPADGLSGYSDEERLGRLHPPGHLRRYRHR